EARILRERRFEHSAPHILAVHMHDPAPMALQEVHRIAACEEAMAGIEEQADILAGVGHQQIDLGIALDDRAHVVMERHPDAEGRHATGKLGDFRAVSTPFGREETRTLRDRPEYPVLTTSRNVRVDDDLAAEIAQKAQMRQNGVVFDGYVILQDVS